MATHLPEIIERHLVRDRRYGRNITRVEHIPPKAAQYRPFPQSIHPDLQSVMHDRGIDQLYSHQSRAIDILNLGKNVVVVTPTASGKTLCYNLPVVNRLIDDPNSRALYLFPTKALSQDQLNELYDITKPLERDFRVYTFDGDTPQHARKAIRTAGHVVVTNPDMLHTGILPHHTIWIKLFENLSYIVIDELHHYRGVFGSHLANVIRRLKRICRFHGSDPQFICCSATIANPKELAEMVVEEPFELVDESGAPQGERYFVFYNPPVVNKELGIRRSHIKEAARLASRFIYEDIQTIIFARSRLRVEILTTYLQRIMRRLKKPASRIRGYRGGYLPLERRQIEQGVKSGEVMGVVSTNALELGIDIGSLSVSIMAGYPGSIASTWQQGGRAGRRQGAALVLLIASSSALDQFMAQHPEYFFGQTPESGIINPDNLAILASHVKCAAFELPFEDGEKFGRAEVTDILRYLEESRILRHTGGRWYWSSERYPAEEISLRSASPENFVILNTSQKNEVIGEVDYESAPLLIHEEAIYIHQTRTFLIDQLNWDERIAYAREIQSDYYTDAQEKTDIQILREEMSENVAEFFPTLPVEEERQTTAAEETGPDNVIPFPSEQVRLGGQVILDEGLLFKGDRPMDEPDPGPGLIVRCFGEVSVTTLAAKYKKIKFETHENVGYGDIHLPEQELQTEAYWLSFPESLVIDFRTRGLDLGSGLHGLATLLLQVAPVFVMCDPKDIRPVAMVKSPHSQRPTVYLYDRYPGGIGICHLIYERHDQVVRAAMDRAGQCDCARGCPSCVGPTLELGPSGKESAGVLLELILSS
jgi:DEAD/DEAH box helicase domain-containing protein